MNGREYIIQKQIQWAKNAGIQLVGSQGDRGRQAYCSDLDSNLYAKQLLPSVRKALISGDGDELGSGATPGKIQAVHSSSAIGINVFQYWLKIDDVDQIAAACGFCRKGSKSKYRLVFEEKFDLGEGFSRSPNIDVVIFDETKDRIYAVECKFSEPYGRRHTVLSAKYFKFPELWLGLDNLYDYAQELSENPDLNRCLHAEQLLKHILGLSQRCKGRKRKFRLLYLWYDVLGSDGTQHLKEIKEFTEVAEKDEVQFHALSYQELILSLSVSFRETHPDYIRYLTGRYL